MINTLSKKAFVKTQQVITPILTGLNHLLWPAVCNICRTSVLETDKGLCRDCWSELLQYTAGDYCPRCGTDASRYAYLADGCGHCQDKKILFDRIARAGVYDGSLRDMILAFKFRDRTELDTRLGMLADAALEACVFRDEIQFIVPVPLHWARRLWRGFNQSLLISRKLKHCPAVVNTDLVRVRYTQRQWNLTPAKRKKNVAGAFAVRRGHEFAGRNVCLVDDITTSRATLNECAGVLKQAGAAKVFALVIAVAMQDNY